LFPSAIAAASDKTVLAKKDPYFSNAEVAKIYVKSYSKLVAAYTGPKQSSVGTSFRDALFTVVDGKNTKDEAWDSAIAEIRKNVGKSN
jgi:cellobiose transport system substrate-binding protein